MVAKPFMSYQKESTKMTSDVIFFVQDTPEHNAAFSGIQYYCQDVIHHNLHMTYQSIRYCMWNRTV